MAGDEEANSIEYLAPLISALRSRPESSVASISISSDRCKHTIRSTSATLPGHCQHISTTRETPLERRMLSIYIETRSDIAWSASRCL